MVGNPSWFSFDVAPEVASKLRADVMLAKYPQSSFSVMIKTLLISRHSPKFGWAMVHMWQCPSDW